MISNFGEGIRWILAIFFVKRSYLQLLQVKLSFNV